MPNEIAVTNDQNGFASMMERLATNKDVDVEKLERMMAMNERILDRNAKMAYSAEFAAMQAELPAITQNGQIEHNGKLISRYTKFEDINEAVKPVLQKFGFGLSFRVKQPNGAIEVTAILSHREGHAEETTISLPADNSGAKNAVQAQGSSVAYGKRYTMCALLNISSKGEDDDGQSADIISTEQAETLDTLVKETKANRDAFLKQFKVDDIRNLKAKDYQTAHALLKRKKQLQDEKGVKQ